MNVIHCLLGGMAIQNINKLVVWHWAEEKRVRLMEERELKGGNFSNFPGGHKSLPVWKLNWCFSITEEKPPRKNVSQGIWQCNVYKANAHHSTELVKSAIRNRAACLLQRYVSAQYCKCPRACGYTKKRTTIEETREIYLILQCVVTTTESKKKKNNPISIVLSANKESSQKAKLGCLLNKKLHLVIIVSVWT